MIRNLLLVFINFIIQHRVQLTYYLSEFKIFPVDKVLLKMVSLVQRFIFAFKLNSSHLSFSKTAAHSNM